jgi:uncharacterized protein YacL (UPF0231 family)
MFHYNEAHLHAGKQHNIQKSEIGRAYSLHRNREEVFVAEGVFDTQKTEHVIERTKVPSSYVSIIMSSF